MSNLFSNIQLTDVLTAAESYAEDRPETDRGGSEVFFTDDSTSTTSLNKIPTDVSSPYPAPSSLPQQKLTTNKDFVTQANVRAHQNTNVTEDELLVKGQGHPQQRTPPKLLLPAHDHEPSSQSLEFQPTHFNNMNPLVSSTSSNISYSVINTDSEFNRFARYSRDVFVGDGDTSTTPSASVIPAPMRQPLHLRPDGVENPSVPPLSIICCKIYTVKDLQDSDVQDKFFSRVFLMKSLQLLLIIGWVILAQLHPGIRNSILWKNELWLYIPAATYVFFLLLVRWVCYREFRPRPIRRSITLSIIMGTLTAMVIATAAVRIQSDIFMTTLLVLFASCTMITVLAWYGHYRIMSRRLLTLAGTTALIVLSKTLLFFILVNMRSRNRATRGALWIELQRLWGPVLGVTIVILYAFILELKCVIAGRRFSVSGTARDWLFATCFL